MSLGRVGRLMRSGSTYTAESRQLFSAMTTPPSTARQVAINNCIKSLKSSGIWSKLGLLYVFAANDSQAALLNWKQPGTYTATAVNSPTFTTDRGFNGDGATSYIDTNLPANTVPNFAQNNSAFGIWSLTDAQNPGMEIGTAVGGADFIAPRSTSNTCIWRLHTGTLLTTNSVTSSIGFFSMTRSTSAASSTYINAVISHNEAAATSTSVTNSNLTYLRGGTNYGTRRIAVGFAGATLTSTEMTSLYNALLAYLQAVGAA